MGVRLALRRRVDGGVFDLATARQWLTLTAG